jgi:hypothetical protein
VSRDDIDAALGGAEVVFQSGYGELLDTVEGLVRATEARVTRELGAAFAITLCALKAAHPELGEEEPHG